MSPSNKATHIVCIEYLSYCVYCILYIVYHIVYCIYSIKHMYIDTIYKYMFYEIYIYMSYNNYVHVSSTGGKTKLYVGTPKMEKA